jgi:hypothetical protein
VACIDLANTSDVKDACLLRIDTNEEIECKAIDPGATVRFSFDLEVTPGQDAELRCQLIDTSGNRSEVSANAGFRDFTAPAAPDLVP